MYRFAAVTVLSALIAISLPNATDAADAARDRGHSQGATSGPPGAAVAEGRAPAGVTHEYHRAGQAAPGDAGDANRSDMGTVKSNPLYNDKGGQGQNPLYEPKGRATTQENPTARPQTQEKPRH